MKIALSTIILSWLLIETCSSQIASTKHLDLGAIKRIELLEVSGDMSGEIFEYRIERNKGDNWVSKRTVTYAKGATKYETSKDPFIRKIPASYLSSLLNSFTNPILTNNIAEFKISKDTLISYLDSMPIPISTDRKLAIVKDINNEFHLRQAFENSLIPKFRDHQTLYQIKLIMLRGDTIVAKARSFGYHYVPWNIDGVRVYDPKITMFYNYLCGNERYEPSRRHYFYKFLTTELLRSQGRILYPQKQR
ncbi:hypothetical protein [Pedobacter psychroterrae]|uniref:Uncharacterized protein n=1 Tax=Pedobacter psychroterrae TaxID=2530453 RepID=A0A4R0NFM3_9SPHI|nr:hypothetical protein [Pedobacter psychroterrae]TCC98958.1 hypothetical protein EZ437_17630 [Pedobacter psychroterrae]